MKEKLAIIGTGIAGMGAAHLLNDYFDLTLFEKNDYVGGHTNTVNVKEGEKDIPIDTGFMVFNKTTYPNLVKLFEELEVPIKKTEMSFSVQHKPTGLEYNGSGFTGLFAQKKNLFNPTFLKMLIDINHFNKNCIEDLESGIYDNYDLKDYILEKGYGESFTQKYIVPMSSAIWSTPSEITLQFPFTTIVRFMKNHGMLGMHTQHQWYTIENGSETYKKKIINPFKDKIHTDNGVKAVTQKGNKVEIVTSNDVTQEFDRVIIAAHGDEAYRILANPSIYQKRFLSKFQYQPNIATLHTDASIMPKNKKIWSAWNYSIIEQDGKVLPSTIYYMNRLQQVSENQDYFVSINQQGVVDPKKIIKEINYTHPIFTLEAIAAQDGLQGLNQNGPIYFCGSYFKYGFHEDAFTSALTLCNQIIEGLSKELNKLNNESDSKLLSVLG
jgi:predicted NAD/FAD-binding protein